MDDTNRRIKQKVDMIRSQFTHLTHILCILDETLFELEQVVDNLVDGNPTVFEIGDVLEITNSYKNKEGTQGQYIKRKGLFLFILDKDGTRHNRVQKNLWVIRRPGDNDNIYADREGDGEGYGYMYDR